MCTGNFDIIFTMKKGWYILYLLRKAFAWFKRMRKQKKTAGDKSSWWHLAANWCASLLLWLKDFKHGSYQFSPLMQYQFKNEIVQVWSYLDRLMLHLILGIITPTFKRVISKPCCHLSGPSTIFYRRYMDDIIILVENKHQYAKAHKLVFKILQELKLTLSPSKSWMGLLKNGFHYLGVHFGVARTPQGKIQMTTIDVHPRTCRRAYDRAALFAAKCGPSRDDTALFVTLGNLVEI